MTTLQLQDGLGPSVSSIGLSYQLLQLSRFTRSSPRGRNIVLLDPGTYIYYNTCTTLDNKPPVYHPGQYSTDLLAARSLDFLNRAVSSREPFFLTVAPIGPHSETILGDKVTMKPPVPAVRHEHLFPHVKVPRNPNFNPALVRSPQNLKAESVRILGCMIIKRKG